MNKKILISSLAVIAAIVVLIIGLGSANKPVNPSEGVTISLKQQNRSGQSGKALIKENNGQTFVTIELSGGTEGVSQPTHVHFGSCANLGPAKYPLTSVFDGLSETLLGGTLLQLKSEFPLAINIHQSETESDSYVACGDIKF